MGDATKEIFLAKRAEHALSVTVLQKVLYADYVLIVDMKHAVTVL